MIDGVPKTGFPGWSRFLLGDFQCTVLTDGPFQVGPPASAFVGASEQELTEILRDAFLPTEMISLQQNMLLIETGRERILFDSGAGRAPEYGGKIFGPTTGRVLDTMHKIGISPDDIDIIALTHAHPDHCWGLTDPAGEPIYKNARILINKVEFEHWMSAQNASSPEFARDRLTFQGAYANLSPYRDRTSFISDREEPIQGIKTIVAAGHSPGHTMYQIESAGEKLLQWGDLAHHPVLIARPELSIVFDFDPQKAAQSRLKVFDWVTNERMEVFACHFGFPGLGHLRRTSAGYDWVATGIDTLER